MLRRAVAIMLLLQGAATAAFAQPAKGDPDWPCTQTYNPDLVLEHVWSGPDPRSVNGYWAADAEIAPLVPRLASTVLPLEKALGELDAFLAATAPADRARRATLLVAGLHEVLDGERKKVIAGLQKLGRSQRALAQAIRERNDQLAALRARPDGAAEAAALEETLQWDLKIFQDRRATVSLACAQPDQIEKRLFALAKRIETVSSAASGG